MGLNIPIHWHPEKAPHMAISGATGSGKTYFTKLLLGKIVKYIPSSQLYVCDAKGDQDFSFLDGADRFARWDVGPMFQRFFEAFQARQRGEDASRNILILMFDEWSNYLEFLSDKRTQEEEKRKLALLVRLGRSFGIHVILGQQRFDASYTPGRENFTVAIIFVPENRAQWCFPLHCLRPLVSYCGSSCGSGGKRWADIGKRQACPDYLLALTNSPDDLPNATPFLYMPAH